MNILEDLAFACSRLREQTIVEELMHDLMD